MRGVQVGINEKWEEKGQPLQEKRQYETLG